MILSIQKKLCIFRKRDPSLRCDFRVIERHFTVRCAMPAGHGTARAIAYRARICAYRQFTRIIRMRVRTWVRVPSHRALKSQRLSLHKNCKTSIKIIKNEIGCRDDTVPKTVGTRRHCEEDGEHATIFRNPLPTSRFLGVAEDCCMLSILLAVPSCTYSFWHVLHPISFLMIFILVYIHIGYLKKSSLRHSC